MKRSLSHRQKQCLALGALLALLGFGGFYHDEGHIERTTSAFSQQINQNNSSRTSPELGGNAKTKAKDQSEQLWDIKFKDPFLQKNWSLESTDSLKAWNRLKIEGSKKVVVAVIDTGIDVNHPALKNSLWTNAAELNGLPNVDDDQNGCVDDIHGCNMITNTGDLTDNHGHGTHIAGIIGADNVGKEGVRGIAPGVSLMILKYYDPKVAGTNNLKNTIQAIRYATNMGANIINYSGGGIEPSDGERQAVMAAQRAGILFVAAAGNEKSNSDIKGYYPADYKLDNIISVTAYNQDHLVLPSSNYGENSVDLAAPGNDIKSTFPNGKYGTLTGTSQATAFVTGVAALILARFPDFKADRIIKHLTQTGDLEDAKLKGKTKHRKRLNTYRALAMLDEGVGVTGVVATNATTSNPLSFAAERAINSESSELRSPNDVVDYSRTILQILQKSRLPSAN